MTYEEIYANIKNGIYLDDLRRFEDDCKSLIRSGLS